MENFKLLISSKTQNFRISLRNQQISLNFQTKRTHFLQNLSNNPPNPLNSYNILHDFHIKWHSTKQKTIENQLIALREHVTKEDFPLIFLEISKTCIFEDCLEILQFFHSDPSNFSIISEVLWIIGQFCSGERAFTDYFTSPSSKIIEKVLKILPIFQESEQVLTMLYFVLGNLIGTDPTHRRFLQKGKILESTLEILKNKCSLQLLQEITWFLSVFLHTKPFFSLKKVEIIYPVLAYTLFLEENTVISNTLWALIPFFEDCSLDFLKTSHFLIDRVFLLLKAKENRETLEILVPATQLLGNLLSKLDIFASFLVEKGVLETFLEIFDVKCLKSQVCWCIGNLLACNDEKTLRRVISHELMRKAINCLVTGKNNEKTEILYGLTQSFKWLKVDLLRFLFTIGLNQVIEENLKTGDLKIKTLILKGIHKLAKRGEDIYRDDGGNEMIILLENGFDLGNFLENEYYSEKNEEIARICTKILEKYYIF